MSNTETFQKLLATIVENPTGKAGLQFLTEKVANWTKNPLFDKRLVNSFIVEGLKPTQQAIGQFREAAYIILPNYVDDGIKLLQGKRFAEAGKHFLNLPSSGGFDIAEHAVRIDATPTSIEEAVQLCKRAANDQVKVGIWQGPFNALELNTATVHLTTYHLPSNTPKDVKKFIDYTHAIAGGEEWSHAIQAQYGSHLTPQFRHSRYVANPNVEDIVNRSEHDVAQLFINKNIPVTPAFMGQYARSSNTYGTPRLIQYPSIGY